MIDLSKIKVGDEVTVRAKVIYVETEVYVASEPIRISGGSWIKRKDILAHTPAPREFKLGDRVTWGNGTIAYEFIAVRGSTASVWNNDYGWSIQAISDLRHADESDEP